MTSGWVLLILFNVGLPLEFHLDTIENPVAWCEAARVRLMENRNVAISICVRPQ